MVVAKNESGLQRLDFNKNLDESPSIESDLLVEYCRNGFGELIIGQNIGSFLEVNTNSLEVDNDLNVNSIKGFIRNLKVNQVSSEIIKTIKTDYYLYVKNQQLLLKTIIDDQNSVEYTDVAVDIDCQLVNKTIFIDNMMFFSTSDNEVFSYQIGTGFTKKRVFSKITLLKQFQDKIYIIDNYQNIFLLNSYLEEIKCIHETSNILGITWYQDEITSIIKYVVDEDGVLKFKEIEVN